MHLALERRQGDLLAVHVGDGEVEVGLLRAGRAGQVRALGVRARARNHRHGGVHQGANRGSRNDPAGNLQHRHPHARLVRDDAHVTPLCPAQAPSHLSHLSHARTLPHLHRTLRTRRCVLVLVLRPCDMSCADVEPRKSRGQPLTAIAEKAGNTVESGGMVLASQTAGSRSFRPCGSNCGSCGTHSKMRTIPTIVTPVTGPRGDFYAHAALPDGTVSSGGWPL